jgi:UDP-glucose 4-epimerase
VVSNLKSGQQNPGSELYMADGTELWRQVEAAAEDPTQPCSVTDLDGRPWYYQPNDARDVAHALVCAVERPEALGESFNLGAPAPFLFPEGARHLAEQTGRKLLEIRLPVQWRYDHAIGKAKGWIGFRPRGDMLAMLNSALAVRRGEHAGYDWDGFGANN